MNEFINTFIKNSVICKQMQQSDSVNNLFELEYMKDNTYGLVHYFFTTFNNFRNSLYYHSQNNKTTLDGKDKKKLWFS